MNLKKSFSLTFNFSLLTFGLPLALFFIANLFYFPIPAKAVNADMPNWKMPELQIKIPGLDFTSTSAIFEKMCVKDKGKITSCAIPWIGEYIAGVYKYAIGIVGILAAVVLMLGGVIWLTAGGNATRVTEAKAWITASLTGLVIALSSYTILYQVNPDLLKFKPLKVHMVKEIKMKEGGTSGTGSTGGVSVKLSEQDARDKLSANKIKVKPVCIGGNTHDCVKLEGILEITLNEIIMLKINSQAEIFITGGTESVHATGRYSHENGYKVDLGIYSNLSNYIKKNFEKYKSRKDGTEQWKNPSTGAIYAYENPSTSNAHWDIVVSGE